MHPFAQRIFQENTVFALIPLGTVPFSDLDSVVKIITAVISIVVAIFAVRYYHANTQKSQVEKEMAEVQLEQIKTEVKVQSVAVVPNVPQKTKRKVGLKPKSDEDADDNREN